MIGDFLVAAVSDLPRGLATVLLSATPIGESRLSIPIAMTLWNIPAWQAYAYSCIGNAAPFFPLFFGFTWLYSLAERRAPWLVRGIDRTIERAHKKVGPRYEQYGLVALFFFVAIPFVGTGVWTASLLATALKLSWQRAMLAILGGMLVMGLLVTLLTIFGLAVV